MNGSTEIKEKIEELAAEMKKAGLWRKEKPAWVTEYGGEQHCVAEPDFFEWLQFVYLPNRLMNKSGINENHIIIQAKKFASEKNMNPAIVSLLIELDAL